jgi:hypothetical protein
VLVFTPAEATVPRLQVACAATVASMCEAGGTASADISQLQSY